MNPESGRAQFVELAFALASYLLWLVTAGLGIVTLLIARTLILETADALGINPWAHGAIDKFGLLILGVVWIILVYAIEAHYRNSAAVSLRKLLRSFLLVTGTQIAFAGLAGLVLRFVI